MSNDNVSKLIQPGCFNAQLAEILREGARTLLAQAVEAEVADFLAQRADLKTAEGRQHVWRGGHLPEREVMTEIDPVAVRQPRVRDREVTANNPGRIRFTPAILPPLHAPLEGWPATSIASSKVRSPAICRCSFRPGSNCSSTSRPQEPSASTCLPRCSQSPARRSNKVPSGQRVPPTDYVRSATGVPPIAADLLRRRSGPSRATTCPEQPQQILTSGTAMCITFHHIETGYFGRRTIPGEEPHSQLLKQGVNLRAQRIRCRRPVGRGKSCWTA